MDQAYSSDSHGGRGELSITMSFISQFSEESQQFEQKSGWMHRTRQGGTFKKEIDKKLPQINYEAPVQLKDTKHLPAAFKLLTCLLLAQSCFTLSSAP